jgi:hypothetical protein
MPTRNSTRISATAVETERPTASGAESGGAGIVPTVAVEAAGWSTILAADLEAYWAWVPLEPGRAAVTAQGDAQTEFPGLRVAPCVGGAVT